ncbi:MAG: hypothetical protein MUF51_10590 [Vicinamibacteria bacterium]|nr:hypothetical protein [Vicinamibacteria bacterium]
MKPRFILTTLVAIFALSGSAWATPSLARRYSVGCHICHEGYPKLNTVGQKFLERGFRMEKEQPITASDWLRRVPVSVQGRLTHVAQEGGTSADIGEIRLSSAGNLGRRLSYWIDDGIRFEKGESAHGNPNEAYLRFDVDLRDRFYVQAGRMELDLPFTQVRSSNIFGYALYELNSGQETEGLARAVDGLELGGRLSKNFRWSAAVVSKDLDVYLRLRARVTDRHRIGTFAYIGRHRIDEGPPQWNDALLRVGIDGDFWIDKVNLFGAALYGRNSNSFGGSTAGGSHEPRGFTGGFVQSDYHLPGHAALTARLQLWRQPVGVRTQRTLVDACPGVKVWLLDRVRLGFEYSFKNQQRASEGRLQAELSF